MTNPKPFIANDFSVMLGKPASPARFQIQFKKPPKIIEGYKGLKNQTNKFENLLGLTAHHVEIPSKQTEVIERRTVGQSRFIPIGTHVSTFNVEFIENSNHAVSLVLKAWQSRIFAKTLQYKVPFYNDIVTDMEVVAYNDFGDMVAKYTMTDVFPITIGSRQLNWGAMNSTSYINVEFAFYDMAQNTFEVELKENDPTLSIFGELKKKYENAAKEFNKVVKTAQAIRADISMVQNGIRQAQQLAKQIQSLKINTSSVGAFTQSVESIGNTVNQGFYALNNFGSGVQRATTRTNTALQGFSGIADTSNKIATTINNLIK